MLEISGDKLKPGPDGHIRHPQEKDLVWWEFVNGERAWVRQNRWARFEDIKTELSAPEIFEGLEEYRAKEFKKQLRKDGIRYKVRRRPYADWNADEGPWEASDE